MAPPGGMLLAIRTSFHSVSVLRRRLGWARTLALLPRLVSAADPFAALGPPRDDRESLSRLQIKPAIQLYKILLERRSPEKALAVVRQVVLDATVLFLDKVLPSFSRESYQPLSLEQRKAYLEKMIDPFPNITKKFDVVTDARFRMTVTACHFPGLCRAAGVPELAPLFCEGDVYYFGKPEHPVHLERGATLARDGEPCDFDFRWKP